MGVRDCNQTPYYGLASRMANELEFIIYAVVSTLDVLCVNWASLVLVPDVAFLFE